MTRHPSDLVNKLNEIKSLVCENRASIERFIYNGFLNFLNEQGQELDNEEIEAFSDHVIRRIATLFFEVRLLADEVLIDTRGQNNAGNHLWLRHHGYHIRAGEQDSFGWLSGIINCGEFNIVYG